MNMKAKATTGKKESQSLSTNLRKLRRDATTSKKTSLSAEKKLRNGRRNITTPWNGRRNGITVRKSLNTSQANWNTAEKNCLSGKTDAIIMKI